MRVQFSRVCVLTSLGSQFPELLHPAELKLCQMNSDSPFPPVVYFLQNKYTVLLFCIEKYNLSGTSFAVAYPVSSLPIGRLHGKPNEQPSCLIHLESVRGVKSLITERSLHFQLRGVSATWFGYTCLGDSSTRAVFAAHSHP